MQKERRNAPQTGSKSNSVKSYDGRRKRKLLFKFYNLDLPPESRRTVGGCRHQSETHIILNKILASERREAAESRGALAARLSNGRGTTIGRDDDDTEPRGLLFVMLTCYMA